MQTVHHLFDEKLQNCSDTKDIEDKKSNVSSRFNAIRPTNQENCHPNKENNNQFELYEFSSSKIPVTYNFVKCFHCYSNVDVVLGAFAIVFFRFSSIIYPPSYKECILYLSYY